MGNAIRKQFISLSQIFASNLTVRVFFSVCTFICIFIYYESDIDKWECGVDTPSYVGENYLTNPWGTLRTPGLALYWQLIGARADLKEALTKFPSPGALNTQGKNDIKVNSLGKKLVLWNILLLGVSFSLLCFSLSAVIKPLLSFIFVLISMYFGDLPSPQYFMADLPGCAMSVLFVAFGILYIKDKRYIFLFLLCFCAIFSCLIKPGMFFLYLIAGCILAYELVKAAKDKNLKKAFMFFCIGCFLTGGTLIWPIILYTHSGIFAPSQISTITKAMFATYLLQEGDERLFTDPKHRTLVAELIKHKPEIDEKVNKLFYNKDQRFHSEAYRYVKSVNFYGYRYFFIMCDEYGFPREGKTPAELQIERARLVNDISGKIMKKHFYEYINTVGRSVLSAFGYYQDLKLGIWRRHNLGEKSAGIFIFCYSFLFFTILFGVKKLRYVLILIIFIHITSVVLMSIGHAVLRRYLGITEWSFILALEVACYSVLLKLLPYFDKIRSFSTKKG